MNAPFRTPRVIDKSWTRWVHELPCVVTGYIGEGVQQAHIRFADAAAGKRKVGMGEKPDDYWSLPLHWSEHQRQHSMKERDYWSLVGKDPLVLCRKLHELYPDTVKATVFVLGQVQRFRR